jgi:hypothetical protein
MTAIRFNDAMGAFCLVRGGLPQQAHAPAWPLVSVCDPGQGQAWVEFQVAGVASDGIGTLSPSTTYTGWPKPASCVIGLKMTSLGMCALHKSARPFSIQPI